MSGPIIRFSSGFLIGYWSNRFSNENLFLRLFVLLSFCISLSYFFLHWFFSSVFWLFFLVGLLLALFNSTINPLLDSITLDFLGSKKKDYGLYRLWGSLGFVFGALVIGFALEIFPKVSILFGVSIFLFVSFFISMGVPIKSTASTPIVFRELLKYFKNRNLILVFSMSLIHVMSLASFNGFFGIFIVDKLGYSSQFLGFLVLVSVMSEVLIFRVSYFFLSRYNSFFLLAFSFFFTVIRWGILYLSQNIVWIILSQTLHAFSWGMFYAACIHYLELEFPSRLRTSGIAAFSSLVIGLGNLLGYIWAGNLTQWFGYKNLFLYSLYLSLLSCFLAVYLLLRSRTFRLRLP